jgi:DNA-binding NtrC family response regulator
MQFLLESLSTRLEISSFIEDVLDLLVDFLGADRGTIFVRMASEQWSPTLARQQHRTVPTAELRDVRADVLDTTLRAGRSKIVPLEASGRTMAATVPLRRGAWHGAGGGPRSLGVIVLELPQAQCSEVEPLHLEFLEAASVLVSVTLDQRARLEAAQEDLRLARAQDRLDEGPTLEELLAAESMSELREDILACVIGDSPVMILGESGTGKTRLAAAIAQASSRTPVVRATLGSSDDLNTITSELFGHERGAFSGAVTSRKGLVEYANGGTLILDEILNLPPHAQQLLLDFTQFGSYRPLGYQGKEPKRASVRLIAATNGNIHQAIADTRFRQDLYFRLAGVIISLPPLRRRRSDVPELAQQHLRRLDPARAWHLSQAARRLLLSDVWDWEGNVRQLQTVIRRARDRALAAGSPGVIDVQHIGQPTRHDGVAAPALAPAATPATPAPPVPPDDLGPEGAPDIEARWTELQARRAQLEGLERALIDQALYENRGVVAHAARQLQVSRTSLLSRMVTLLMDKDKYKR